MKNLLAAFSFLTAVRLPGKEPTPEEMAQAPAWFPAVGLALGLCILFIGWLDKIFDFPRIAAFLAVAFLAAITRGLHLDGVADWADGLGGRNKEDTLRIMADPGIGSFGIAALILVLLGKYLFFSELFSQEGKYAALVLAPVISRWMLSYFLVKMPYARQDGTASVFKDNPPPMLIEKASAFVLACIIIASPLKGLIYWGCGFLVSTLIYYQARKKIHGITGDVLGAMAEISEVAVLALAVLY
jgi:adenosylcobinamide-GDP ribazoletransferase